MYIFLPSLVRTSALPGPHIRRIRYVLTRVFTAAAAVQQQWHPYTRKLLAHANAEAPLFSSVLHLLAIFFAFLNEVLIT